MLKIAALALVCAVLVTYLKSVGSEFYSLALVGSGIIILYFGIEYVVTTVDFFNKIAQSASFDENFLPIIFKIISIGYIVEFGAGLVEDMGVKSLADKLVFIGKLIILSVSIPVFYAVFELIGCLL